jgi:2-keto-3-deoxy-L-rhamnonate aldolase RhmA
MVRASAVRFLHSFQQDICKGVVMTSHIVQFRDKLSAGKVCFGPCITFTDPAVSEALAGSADFLWIDLEHTAIGIESLLGHLLAARATQVPALVRVPSSELSLIKRVLDIGADGIIVPQICSVDEARSVVSACRYAPKGSRGWGPRRATEYGRISQEVHMANANEQLFVALQIENLQALENVAQIVRIDGLDSVVIGPFDLSASMGLPGQLAHPKVKAAMLKIVETAHAAGVWVGVGTAADLVQAREAVQMGVEWIQMGLDYAYMVQASDRFFEGVRSVNHE